MTIRKITDITLSLGTGNVGIATIVDFNGFASAKYYEVLDETLVELAQSKNLDTWAELEVCELLDRDYELLDPMSGNPVVTTYVGQP